MIVIKFLIQYNILWSSPASVGNLWPRQLKKNHFQVVSFPRQMSKVTIHPAENLFIFGSGRILSIAELTDKENFIFQDYTHHSVS